MGDDGIGRMRCHKRMKLRDLEKLKVLDAVFTPMEAVQVWQVIELVDVDDKKSVEQHSFVLASGIEQLLRIVGKDERRKIILTKELCPITQLPGDVYRVRYINPKEAA
jgi:hypothetical protein